VAAVVNEIAKDCGQGILIREQAVRVQANVAAASDLLGLSPIEIANEGVVVAVVAQARTVDALELLRAHPLGRDADLIGEVDATLEGRVVLETRVGGRRGLDLPRGILLPRIC
jgi:hydrogenase expression/formation protein HypE